jgi:hypothetical protein
MNIASTKTVEGLINKIAKSQPKKAISINEDMEGYNLRDADWTNKKEDGSITVDHNWAVEYLAYKYDTISKQFAMDFSGKSRSAVGDAIEDSDNIVKVDWGTYAWKN